MLTLGELFLDFLIAKKEFMDQRLPDYYSLFERGKVKEVRHHQRFSGIEKVPPRHWLSLSTTGYPSLELVKMCARAYMYAKEQEEQKERDYE
jgi:hypothetical protein